MNALWLIGACLMGSQQELPIKKAVDRAIAELNSEDVERREAATEKLRTILAYPRMALRRAAASKDLERAARAAYLLGERKGGDGARSKVRGLATSPGLLVIGAGRADGVERGMNVIMIRDGRFVCAATINRVDRTWASGRIRLMQMQPRVADEVLFEPSKSTPRTDPPLQKRLDELYAKELELWKTSRFAVEPAGRELLGHFGLNEGLRVHQVGSTFWDLRVDDLILGYRTEADLLAALKSKSPPDSLTLLRKGKRMSIREAPY